LKKGKVA
jgi:hypothetical protein